MIRKTDPDIIKGYLEDSSNLAGGHAEGVYLPESAQDIAEALRECSAKKIPLTVSAGQTGTTGGCIPFGGWVLSTQKLNKVLDFSPKERFAVIQPGVNLDEIDALVKKEGLLYPPDPTEKKATIGGNISTNASGGRSYRFGSTRNWIKAIKVRQLNGEELVLERNSSPPTTTLKNSAGYYQKPGMELIDLFICSEGTLGVIAEVKIMLSPALPGIFDLVAFFPTETAAVDFVDGSKQAKDPTINFYEFFDENTLQMLKPAYSKIPTAAKAAIYIEQEINRQNENTYLDYWSSSLGKHGASLDTSWIGEENRQFRHAIPEHINEIFKQYHQIKLATDIAVPEGKFKEMFDFYDSQLEENSEQLFSIKFGHIGDNHLHVNLVAKKEEYLPLAKEIIFRFVRKGIALGGTVSAEHGIGKIKHDYLREMFGENGLQKMRRIKRSYDPDCLLGRNNIFSC